MFEKFTDDARRTIVLGWIGTEHLLLGLLYFENPASSVLGRLGLLYYTAERRVVDLVASGVARTVPAGEVPDFEAPVRLFTARAKKVLELALRESLAFGSNEIDSGHVLLGLIREGEGLGARIVREAGIEGSQVRQDLIARWSGAPTERKPWKELLPLLTECPECHAAVPKASEDDHASWHNRLAGEGS